MSMFRIEIDTDNDAFQPTSYEMTGELTRIINNINLRGREIEELRAGIPLSDINGTKVGRAQLIADAPRPDAECEVAVAWADIMGYGHEYEAFSDLLRERACDTLGLANENGEWNVTEYQARSVDEPHVITFWVAMENDDDE